MDNARIIKNDVVSEFVDETYHKDNTTFKMKIGDSNILKAENYQLSNDSSNFTSQSNLDKQIHQRFNLIPNDLFNSKEKKSVEMTDDRKRLH